MFHLLVERISGLVNRRIFYLPFSRDVVMNIEQINNIQMIFKKCIRVQGILVAQPEHILSFRLMVVEKMLSSSPPLDPVARKLQEMQAWLTSTSRDILDESDELLHVRYQLIYAMDEQQPLDGGPDRWTTIQNVFDLVHCHMKQLRDQFPEEIEIFERHGTDGQFFHIPLLGISASQALVSRIAEDVLDGALDNLTFVGLNRQPALRTSILRFIMDRSVDSQTYRTVKDFFRNTRIWKSLLLLRGLLAHGVLICVFSQRRWRVDYGLDLKRSLLAVPYRAKVRLKPLFRLLECSPCYLLQDIPSLRSEFGHPDVAICLTCLSYYYGGLTPSQVQECFNLLSKLDNPALEYERWVKWGRSDIPVLLRQLVGVNTKDVQTFTTRVIPIFQHNQVVINFFLSQIVFPRHKGFLSKIGTSGWDLAEHKRNFTTGFSGTNDNSVLLPTSITQCDPVSQIRTNAQVLEYLLRPENNNYICMQRTNGQPLSVREVLQLLVRERKEVRVLLDVGAQVSDIACIN